MSEFYTKTEQEPNLSPQYTLTFYTTDENEYLYMQECARKCVDKTLNKKYIISCRESDK